MPLTKVETKSKGLPFFDAYAKEIPTSQYDNLIGQVIYPLLIKKVKSGKGFMLNFNHDFNVFVWNNSGIGSILNKTILDEQGHPIGLEFISSKDGVGFELGVDETVITTLYEDKYSEGLYSYEDNNPSTPIAPIDKTTNLRQLRTGFENPLSKTTVKTKTK